MKPVLAALFAALLLFGCIQQPAVTEGNVNASAKEYEVNSTGFLHNFLSTPNYSISQGIEANGSTWYNVSFQSAGFMVYGLLRVPNGVSKPKAVLLLPGAMVKKEDEQGSLGRKLSEWGFASLAIDARGVGESRFPRLSMDFDFQAFSKGGEPMQHLMVRDAIAAYKVLQKIPEVDASHAVIVGESLGGRLAVIAAAVEPSVAGVVAVSAGAYGFPAEGEAKRFVDSFEPVHYAALVAPRELVFVHCSGDSGVPVSAGRKIFDAAIEPKKFIEVNCSIHGYRPEMDVDLERELGRLNR